MSNNSYGSNIVGQRLPQPSASVELVGVGGLEKSA